MNKHQSEIEHLFGYCSQLDTICVLLTTDNTCFLSTTSASTSETIQLKYETEIKINNHWTYKHTFEFTERPSYFSVHG